MKYRLLFLLLLVFLTSCQQSTEATDTKINQEMQVIVHPTKLVPSQNFEISWHVPLDLEYRTGVLYDTDSRKPEFYSYEFVTEFKYKNGPGDFTTNITSFDSGEIYLRPFAISNNQVYYGQELSIEIS